jgi:hypothetical protein
MKLTKNIIKRIERELYNDIDLSDGNAFYLSSVKDDLFCVFTRKDNHISSFFSDGSLPELNIFFDKLTNMLLSSELDGDGCFDYEHYLKNEYDSVKAKANNYFNYSLNLILLKYSKGKVVPVSFFTYLNGYIWNVCTEKKSRDKGYMTILFIHFLKLLKEGELKDDVQLYDNSLSLNLLKKNPQFYKTKQFYEDNGFAIKQDMPDKIILVMKIS